MCNTAKFRMALAAKRTHDAHTRQGTCHSKQSHSTRNISMARKCALELFFCLAGANSFTTAQKTDASATNALCPTPSLSIARSGHRQLTSAAEETEYGRRDGGGARPRRGMWRRLIGSTVVAWCAAMRMVQSVSRCKPVDLWHSRIDMSWRGQVQRSRGRNKRRGRGGFVVVCVHSISPL